MNGSIIVAQANGQGTGQAPVQTIKITKPADGQAVTFEASFDGSVLIDFSAITNEKITLVHVAEKLIILFDNQSTATIEPFFDSMRLPLQNLTIEVAPGNDLSGSQFASTFPITDDQSVLPAAGGNGNAASGANFSSAAVDPLGLPNPLPLLGPETLPNFVVTFDQVPNRPGTLTGPATAIAFSAIVPPTIPGVAAPLSIPIPTPNPSTTAPAFTSGITGGAVDEGGLLSGAPGDIYGTGNDPGFATSVSGSLSDLVNFGTSGASAVPFQFVSSTAATSWVASLGLSSHGDAVNAASITVSGNTETLVASTSGVGAHEVFSLTLNETTGAWTFTLINPLDEPNPGHGTPGPAVEDTISIDLSGLVLATASNGDSVVLSNDFAVTVTDDVPVISGTTTGSVDEGGLVAGSPGDLYGNGNDPGFATSATGSLAPLVHFGADGPQVVNGVSEGFQFVPTASASVWLASLGLTSHGSLIDTAAITVSGNIETLTASTSGAGAHEVFTLALNESTGAWTFTLINPLDHPTDNGENTSTIDLSALVQAIDFDGDSVTLANDFSVTVTDDVPVVVPNNGGPTQSSLGAVDEGGLVSGSPGDLYGNGNDSGFAISATGLLSTLVHFGADGPAADGFQFVSATTASAWLAGLGLTSHGSLINTATITTSSNTETLTASTSGAGAHEVFTLALNEGTGAWTFTLINPLDQPTDNGENTSTLDLSGLVQATDFDGDSVTLAHDFFVTVTDDVPVVVPNNGGPTQSSLGAVDEGGLTSGSPGDLYGNGNDSGFAISATGLLSTLVHFGADGPAADGFQFVSATTASAWLAGLGLTSHGSLINTATITTSSNTETLTASTSGAGAHEVFTLALNEGTGAWTFTLINPLDQPTDNGENTSTLDLSGLVQATDFDGDSVTLAHDFFVTVTDDVPVVVPNNGGPTQSSLGAVDEGGLVSGSPGDLYGNGNDSGFAISATGLLSTLVHFGADGPAADGFQFVSATTASAWLAGLGLTSHGSLINTATITTSSNTETLTASTSGAGAHEVFTLALNEGTGAWTFTLINPLDQPTDNGENTSTLDLSGLVQATDFDGDSVTLAHDFFVTVTDDVPVVVPNNGGPTQSSLGAVDEGGLTSGSPGDLYGNGNDSGFAVVTSNSLSTLVHFGADGPAANEFQFVTAAAAATWLAGLGLTSHGSLINAASIATVGSTETLTASTSGVGAHEVFTLALDETTGTWTFTLINPIDHATGNGENTATIDLSGLVQGVDFDGDAVTLSHDVFVTVTDDVPVVVPNNGGPTQSSLGAVDEGGLTSGSPGDLYGNGNDSGFAVVTSNSLSTLVHFGADGPAAIEFQFVTAAAAATWLAGLGLTSHGSLINAASIATVGSTETLTASTSGVGAHEVFTLALNEGTGAWTFTLINPLDQPTDNGENTSTLDLSGLVQATDFDGDSVTLAHDFFVTVTDDVPVVVPNNGGPTQSSLGAVDEGGLVSGSPGDLYGNGNDSGFAISATGLLSTLVHFGADGPAADGFQFVSATTASAWLAGLGLTSHGSLINTATITTSSNTETLTASTSGAGAHEVFTLALNEGTGAWTFTLINPLDQPTDNGENTSTLDLSGLVQATDFDGDSVTLAHDFFVTVTDDVPVVVPNNGGPTQSSLGAVDEGGLTSGSPGDLYGNGNDSGFAVVTSNSLSTLVHFGADGPAANEFQFVTAAAAATWLAGLGLTSHGSLINAASIATVGSTETLTASTSGVGAHEVFTLALDETTGTWTFTLINPIDHATGNGENTATIDLSGLVQGVDFDGDAVTLSHDVFVTVTDDVPVVVPNNGGPTQSSLGTIDDPGTLAASGSLSTLVHFGADGPAANEFQFTTVAAASTWLTSLGLFSHNSQITTASIATSGSTETLTASAADGHTVFTLALNEGTGAWTFTLVNPLDPPAGSHTNTNVIDLSGLVQAVDFDGDPATLSHDFFVTVNGPTDQLSTPALTIDADGTSGQAGPESTNGLFSIPVLALLNNDSDTLGNAPLNFKVTGVSGTETGLALTSDHQYVLFPMGGSGSFTITVSDGTTTANETITVNNVGGPVSGSATAGNDFLVENLAAGQNMFGDAGNDTLVANTQGGSNVYGGNFTFPVTGGGNDLLIGSSAGDNLYAGPGNDTLWGRGGGDNLFGNTIANSTTTFYFENTGDGSATIGNFDSASGQNDAIAVSAAGFGGGLTANSSVSSVFATAANANFPSGNADRFVFDTTNHGLYYSPDGTTAHEVLLATVTNHTVTAGDVHVVA